MLTNLDLNVPLVFLLAAVPYAWLGLFAWRKRPAVAVTPFAWTMLGLSIWAFAYSLEIYFPQLHLKLFFTSVEYIGIVSIPVFMLFFAVEFIGKRSLLTPRTRLLIWVIPTLILLLVWTNPFHHLMWDMETITEFAGITLLNVRFGVFFWIHAVFSYGLLILASTLLIIELLQRPGIYRIQISLVVLSILIPLGGSLVFVSGTGPVKNLDLAPLFFLPMALGLAWAIARYHLFDVLPLEHLTVLKNMRDGVIVLNPHQRIVYINPVTEGLFNCMENEAVGQPLGDVSETFGAKLAHYLTGGEHRAEIVIGQGSQARVYDVTVSPLHQLNIFQDRAPSDSMIILHDITERKNTEMAISRRESIMSSINLAAEQFLKESAWEHNIPAVLEKIGRAADVSRIHVVMNYIDKNGGAHSSLCYEWAAPGVSSQINNPALQHMSLHRSGFGRWENTLSQGHPIYGMVRDFPEDEKNFLQRQGSISIAVMPIFVDNQWWGFIMFDECRHERRWTTTELEALHIAANIFGSAETRARTEQKLVRRQHTLNLLHEIVLAALQSDDLDSMAQIVVDRLGELIKADGCFLSRWDEEQEQPVPLSAYGPYRDTYLSLRATPGEGTFTELAFRENHTLVIEDANIPPYNQYRLKKVFPFQSILVLPLVSGGKRMGAIMLTFEQPHNFQPEEIAISEQAAGLIALAMEKYQAVEKAQRRADASETLRKASATVAETLATNETVNRILEQLNQVIPCDSASVQLLDGNELVIVGGRGFADPKSILGIRFPITGEPNSIVMGTGKPHYIPETDDQYPNFNEIGNLHIRSWLGVPLIFQGKIIGLLTIDSTKSNHFKEEDIKSASEFSNQVAIALENARIFEEAQSQAVTDALTGLLNRRGLFQFGEFELQRAHRIQRPLCAVIFDIDHFKTVNDQFSHTIGDQILHKLADRCRNNSRAIDLIGRYGGEEFVIILPETNLESARRFAERLRLSIMNGSFTTDAGPLSITVSIGVTEANAAETLQTLIERADGALYNAKHAGRNCVMVNETV